MYGYDASLNVKNSFPVFSTHIEANFVSKREDVYSLHALTDDDKAHVLELARDPRIGGWRDNVWGQFVRLDLVHGWCMGRKGNRGGIACVVSSGLLGQADRAHVLELARDPRIGGWRGQGVTNALAVGCNL